MPNETARKSGRPRVAVLSRELILRTGLRLLDEAGTQGAGIRDIARELKVRPSALYNHISGQDELLAGIRELISDRIDVSGFATQPWDRALEIWAVSYWRAFAAHPPTIALFAVLPMSPNSRTGHMWDAVCAGLIAAGWPTHRVLSLIVGCESFILGSALDAVAPQNMLDPGMSDGMESLKLAYAARAAEHPGRQPAQAAFELTLQTLLTGLRAEFEQYASDLPAS